MTRDRPFQGSLFAEDFLRQAITGLPDWRDLADATLGDLEAALRGVFERFPTDMAPNESQTEDDLIWPTLAALGWTASLRQQNLSARGRQDVPDGLLFADGAAKDRANRFAEEWKRYEHGLAVVESKRWLRPLDRRSGRRGEESAPEQYEIVTFGPKTAAQIVHEAVLELTYTACDMAPFAVAMGHVDEDGEVFPPFRWEDDRRLHIRAKLDALYFHLYGVTDRDDIRYTYSTFPTIEREETAAYGTYRSRALCLAWSNALAAGDPDAVVTL